MTGFGGARVGVASLALALAACASSRRDGDDACEGHGPPCLADCREDIALAADCVAGEWVCPAHTVPYAQCGSGGCFHTRLLPGEVCEGSEVVCRPDDETFAACPGRVCVECGGLDPQIREACRCACDAGGLSLRCEPVAPSPCEGLDFCACHERADCTPLTDTCLCHCDYACPGHAPCNCDCGGGDYLGCGAL